MHIVAGALALAVALAVAIPASTGERPPLPDDPALRALSAKAIDDAVREAIAAPDNPEPSYPYAARRMGYEGRVLLEVQVLPDGRVGNVVVAESSGYGMLDRSAAAALHGWRFEPAVRDGVKAASLIRIPITFELTN